MNWKQRSFLNEILEYWNAGLLESWKRFYTVFQYSIIPIFLFFLVGCDSEMSTVPREITKNDLYIERATDIEMLYSDSAVVRLSIQAPTLLNHIKSGHERKEFPDGIKVDFFNEVGQTTSTLTAKSAVQNDRENKIFIREDVVVKSQNNETLETDELIWDERAKNLYTDKWVKVSTPDEVIYGYGFTANQEFTYWKISKVRGRFSVGGDLKQEFN